MEMSSFEVHWALSFWMIEWSTSKSSSSVSTDEISMRMRSIIKFASCNADASTLSNVRIAVMLPMSSLMGCPDSAISILAADVSFTQFFIRIFYHYHEREAFFGEYGLTYV
jgi:hypothetical protein